MLTVPLPGDKPLLDLLEAAPLLGIGRSTAYELAKRGKLPIEVLRIGARYKIRTADLRRYLGLDVPTDPPPPPAPPVLLTVRLPGHVHDELAARARDRGVPVSRIARELIESALSTPRP